MEMGPLTANQLAISEIQQINKLVSYFQPRSQDQFFFFWGGYRIPVDFLNLTPLNPPTKTSFLAHFVLKMDLLVDLAMDLAISKQGLLQGNTLNINGTKKFPGRSTKTVE